MLIEDEAVQLRASVRRRAIELLARRDHSRLELNNKLRKKFPDADEQLLVDVLEQLAAEQLLDEYRFTEVFVHSKISKGFGPVYIRHALIQRGIGADLMCELLPTEQEFWADRLREMLIKRFRHVLKPVGQGESIPRSELLRVRRYCQGRGFDSSQLFRVVEEYRKGDMVL
jgi:regulatory protein